jgi:putative chitinase
VIDWRAAQRRLGVKQDGIFGAVSYGALFSTLANNAIPIAIDLGQAMYANAHTFHVDDNPDRLASFMGQCCHESGGFQHMQELGGSAYFTRLYEGRKDLGNTQPGDGARFHGRGPLQITGRANYRQYGAALGLDLIGSPDLAATPSVGIMIALQFWLRNGLNEYADREDWTGQTRKINGGTKGLRERVVLIEMAKELLA